MASNQNLPALQRVVYDPQAAADMFDDDDDEQYEEDHQQPIIEEPDESQADSNQVSVTC